jgi:sec-independent protein translocase protein TatA
MLHSLAIGMPGVTEWVIIGLIGLLLFGKRLPEVGRSLGKGIIEFKKGLKGIDDDVQAATEEKPKATLPPGQAADPSTYKFDPQTGKPLNQP